MKRPTAIAELESHTLTNGLRVVLARDPRIPIVALNLWYHVGSKNEQPERTGLAHLFEHLLFEGSENVGKGEHFRYVQEAGGVANGSTWYDRTNYFETLPSHQLDLGLWLESDRLGFLLPGLDQEKLDNQRDVVINERRQRVDNQPYGRASERLHELVFDPGHPYRWPVIGSVEHLEATTLDDVRDFFGTFYSPNNAVLTLAGDIDPDDALRRVEHWFGEIERGPAVSRPVVPESSLHKARRDVLADRIQLPRVYVAAHASHYGTDSWLAADLLTTALAGGKTSLLYEDLVYRRRWAQDVSAYVYPTESAAMIVLASTARAGVDIDRLEGALHEHLDRVIESVVDDEHLDRARDQHLTDFYGRWQTLERRADMLSRSATFLGDPAIALAETDRYRSIDRESVRAFAESHLGFDQRAVLTVVAGDPEAAAERESPSADGEHRA